MYGYGLCRAIFVLCQCVRASLRMFVMAKLAHNVKQRRINVINVVSRSMQHDTVDTTLFQRCGLVG